MRVLPEGTWRFRLLPDGNVICVSQTNPPFILSNTGDMKQVEPTQVLTMLWEWRP